MLLLAASGSSGSPLASYFAFSGATLERCWAPRYSLASLLAFAGVDVGGAIVFFSVVFGWSRLVIA